MRKIIRDAKILVYYLCELQAYALIEQALEDFCNGAITEQDRAACFDSANKYLRRCDALSANRRPRRSDPRIMRHP
jgi:hypothetical protein